MKGFLIACVCAVALAVAIPAAAHHSMAGFDRAKTVSLAGTVVQFKWANPHSWIEIDVPGEDGKLVRWNVEMTAPAYLVRAGWKSTTLKPGDMVTVVGNPLINGDPGAIFVSVKLAGGQELTQRAAPAGKGKGKGAK
jgi:hypothetical protein